MSNDQLKSIMEFGEKNGMEPILSLALQRIDATDEVYIDLGKTQKELSVDAASIYKAAEHLVKIGFCSMQQHHKCGFNLK